MKYDIAKNEDGPLRKTVKAQTSATERTGTDTAKEGTVATPDIPISERYPALEERLQNIEKHVPVRYGRCTPACQRMVLNWPVQCHQCLSRYSIASGIWRNISCS